MPQKPGPEHMRKGPYTPEKQVNLQTIMAMVYAVAIKARDNPRWGAWRRCPWVLLLDGSAGPGRDEDGDYSGFVYVLKQMQARGIYVQAFLCEKEHEAAEALRQFIKEEFDSCRTMEITVYEGLFEEKIDQIIADITECVERSNCRPDALFGMAYFDPCGHWSADVWLALRKLAKVFPRVDQLLHFSGTTLKRMRGAGGALGWPEDVPRLVERLSFEQSGKKHFQVGIPAQGDTYQWTFLLLSNFRFKPLAKARLFNDDDPLTLQTLERLNFTNKERRAGARLQRPVAVQPMQLDFFSTTAPRRQKREV